MPSHVGGDAPLTPLPTPLFGSLCLASYAAGGCTSFLLDPRSVGVFVWH